MPRHALRRLAPMILALAAATAGCDEQQLGFEADQTPPTVSIDKTAGDTLQVEQGIVFAIRATDNLGLKTLSVTLSAGFDAQFDTTFTTAVTDLNFGFDIPLPENTTAGGDILIAATVFDGNDNQASALDSVFLVNESALTVRILDPQTGATTAADRQIPLNIRAIQETGIRRVGYTMTGVVEAADSQAFQLPDTAFFTTDFTVPANTETGEFTIVGFAVDSSGRRATSSPVTVTVQDITADADPPIVTFTIAERVEVTDSIHVSATDPSGITEIGWEGIDLATGTTMFGGSETASGALTQINRTFPLDLDYTEFPQQLEIVAFAVDGNGNRGEAREEASLDSPLRRDTVTVVNGITKPLPAGGRVADGIYNQNQDELYLTNVDRNRIEVFRVADTAYVAGGIPVGSRPWGIALWPRDTLGNNADTVVVANSGGTNLSVVDVAPAARRETRRHRLPSFLVQFVSTEINPDNGEIALKIEEFDMADRPQSLGMVCRPNAGLTACAPDSIIAVFSTAPTPGQTGEFTNRGTVRWENLTSGTASSHFFYEHASVAPSPDFDSLQVLIDRPLTGIDTLLHVAKGIVVDREQLVFQDTTFIRNSGNFTHALIGEGDIAQLARAIGYNGNAFLEQSVDCTDIDGTMFCGSSQRDNGITGTARVRDFVANTATRVKSIAVNFNGLTNVVRADDSVYVLDERLFLGGVIPVGGENAGMDLNFQHAFDPFIGGTPGTFGGNGDPNLRMIFLARPDANIDVFDTFRFERVTTIPIRDPIIGPLRVALLPSGDQILVGVTSRGVVTVQLPQIVNIFPTVDDDGPDLR